MASKTILSCTLSLLLLSCNATKEVELEDALLFPVENYTTETLIVNTGQGEKTVMCKVFRHLPYVAKPIDTAYQSLDVLVPLEIAGEAVDAEKAPILFDIRVGGYISVNNAKGNVPGAPMFPGAPPHRERDTVETSNASDRSRLSADNLPERVSLALAAGFVVVTPGCRGRDNQAADGTYYGKAPAAILDLKAAVRYLRHNQGIMPGNTDKIISVGCSAGGALSALLGTSGNSPLYHTYLQEMGAANVSDQIFACAAYSPITDLENADIAYEWMYGDVPTRSGLVDADLSMQLEKEYAAYQASLNLPGKDDFGILTADNYEAYLLKYYLKPAAAQFLLGILESERKAYLAENAWITWENNTVDFTFSDYNQRVGRMKGLPAFDDLAKRAPEPILFGDKTTNARHFTNFSLRQETGDAGVVISEDLQHTLHLMNAMYFAIQQNEGCAPNWWLRNGTSDNHTSQTVMINLATALESQGKSVDAGLFWDARHCQDEDPEGFIKWIQTITQF